MTLFQAVDSFIRWFAFAMCALQSGLCLFLLALVAVGGHVHEPEIAKWCLFPYLIAIGLLGCAIISLACGWSWVLKGKKADA